jgi:hypothetical protein
VIACFVQISVHVYFSPIGRPPFRETIIIFFSERQKITIEKKAAKEKEKGIDGKKEDKEREGKEM